MDRLPDTAPNQAWVADVTYCWTDEGWLYLAVVLDLCARRIVGWATSAHLDRDLIQTALARALAVRGGVRLHTRIEAASTRVRTTAPSSQPTASR